MKKKTAAITEELARGNGTCGNCSRRPLATGRRWADLKDTVMQLSRIKRSPYYEKVFSMAEKARIVRKDRDRCGRIVVMLLPL